MRYVTEITYTDGRKELFGPFPTHEQARAWSEGLQRRPRSMVATYQVRPINPI